MKKENTNKQINEKGEYEQSDFDDEFFRHACDISVHPMESF
jgi:hypothetical protein